MDIQSHPSRLLGPRTPLVVPGCMLAHLVEHDIRTTPSLEELSEFNDWPAPDLMWDVVFPSVLDAFFAATLDEIDVQMYMQHRLGIYSQPLRVPRADFAPELGAMPTGMLAVPGIEMAAFCLEVHGRRNIRPARRWLAEVFIPQWIEPVLQEPRRLPRYFVELGFLDIRPR